ncbi:MAG: helix-turn-helix transcriptional regulator [Cyanobacteria bacterium P01_A01_bin.135]
MGRASKALKQVLETRGISQNRLATELGITRTAVFRWFHDTRDPTAETVVQIVRALKTIDVEAAQAFIGLYLGDLIGEGNKTAGPYAVARQPGAPRVWSVKTLAEGAYETSEPQMNLAPPYAIDFSLARAEYLLTYRLTCSFWRGVLGFTAAANLRNAILAATSAQVLALKHKDGYGDRYEASVHIAGPSGSRRQVRTLWMALDGEQVARFVTAFPARVGSNHDL